MENRIKNLTEDPTYYSIDGNRNERKMTPAEVDEIFRNSATEQRGHAVYDVEEIITVEGEETGWDRKLWAYRIGDTWTYVPKAFESMTIHWRE